MRLFFLLFVSLVSTVQLSAILMPPDLEKFEKHITAVSEEVTNSVVHIKVEGSINNKKFGSMGSGFVISSDGLIFTNHHVVDNSLKVIVRFHGDPREYEAKIIGSDEPTDVAVIQVDAKQVKNLRPVTLGKSKKSKVGQWVLAVGNPYGLDRTVSFGIISAIGRTVPQAPVLNDFLQTDAFIAPGSSGGPLLNMQGEVIGINSRGGSGLGFTIPIETALEVRDKIIKSGSIQRGFLGIQLREMGMELRERLGITGTTGVLVSLVLKSSNFYGKLKPLDVLIAINGASLQAVEESDVHAIVRRLSELPVGQEVKLLVLRDGKKVEITGAAKERPPAEGKKWQSPLGFVVTEITDSLAENQQLEDKAGAYVTFVDQGSSAHQAGLMVGDVLRACNGKPIPDLNGVQALFSGNSSTFLLHVMRHRAQFYVVLKK